MESHKTLKAENLSQHKSEAESKMVGGRRGVREIAGLREF